MATNATDLALERLNWLAELLRSHGVAKPPLPDLQNSLRDALGSELTYLPVQTLYTARALAVSPSGARIAVGTKAGSLHIVERRGGIFVDPKAGRNRSAQPEAYYALRGLSFANDDQLVTCYGAGIFRTFDRVPGGTWTRSKQIQLRGHDGRYIDQVRGLLCLRTAQLAGSDARLAVAFTGNNSLHCLERSDGELQSVQRRHVDVFPGWNEASGVRLAGATFVCGRLWVLDDAGVLRAYERTDSHAGLSERYKFQLMQPHAGAPFVRMWGTDDGLAVYAGTYLSVVQPQQLIEAGAERAQLHWIEHPGVTEVSVLRPCFSNLVASRAAYPIWLYVASNQAGLMWIPWFESDDGRMRPSSRPPFRSYAAVGPHQAVHVQAFSVPGAGEDQPPASFLAVASRDERLTIASFVDLAKLSVALAEQLPSALEHAQPLSPSLAIWLARRRLYHAFKLNMAWTLRPRGGHGERARSLRAPSDAELSLLPMCEGAGPPPAWLSLLAADDLRELALDLLRILRLKESRPDAATLTREFRAWTMLILHRVTELEEGAKQGLAAELATTLVSGLRTARELPAELSALGTLLNKWIVRGLSFHHESKDFEQHAIWNRSAGRRIDALVYATALINQRVDLFASSDLPRQEGPNPGIWGLVVSGVTNEVDQGFTIQSHTDGRITACATKDGAVLSWQAPQRAQSCEFTVPRNDEYRSELWYGKFARDLAVTQVVREGVVYHLLVFGARGWPSHAPERSAPTLHALVLRYDASERCLHVLAQSQSSAQQLLPEVYAVLPLPAAAEGDAFNFVVGASGERGSDPILMLRVRIDGALDARIELLHAHPASGSIGLRNAAWGLAYAAKHNLLFVGRDDGRLSVFETLPDGFKALEQLKLPRLPSSVRVMTTASVGEHLLLAVGCADSTLGLLRVAHAADQRAESAWLMYTQESSRITGLRFYTDELAQASQPSAAPHQFLMALTHGGVIALFDAGLHASKSNTRDTTRERRRWLATAATPRRQLSGARVDRFGLRVMTRGLALLPNSCACAPASAGPPGFVVATAEGQLRFYRLSVPKGTARRTKLADENLEPYDQFEAVEKLAQVAITKDYLTRWLRITQIGSEHLVRYSVWVELNRAAKLVLAALASEAQPIESALKAYLEGIHELSEELFRRRPFSKESIKIVWDEGGRVMNAVGRAALAGGEHADALLTSYTLIGEQLSRLCNQWVGFDPTLEAYVLIHSFCELFDWPAVLLISSETNTEPMRRAQQFVLRELLRRRLSFDGPLVAIETMRLLNAALERALDQPLPRRAQAVAHTGEFFELLKLLGAFANKRQSELDSDTPLRAELARCIALCVLWLPDGVLELCGRLSVLGLVEPRCALAGAALGYTQLIRAQLESELGLAGAALTRVDDNISRLRAYLTLNAKALECIVSDARDAEYAGQLAMLLACAEQLAQVDNRPISIGTLPPSADECLLSCHVALTGLQSQRTQLARVLSRLDEPAGASPEALERGSEHKRALALCEAARSDLCSGNLFEPHRSHYLAIVDKWQQTVHGEQAKLSELFLIIDMFNRHVYQAAADDLVASMLELALRAAPMSHQSSAEGNEPLRWRVRKELSDHPLLLDLYERGLRLVDYAHLSGTLLRVAREAVTTARPNRPGSQPPIGLLHTKWLTQRLEELCAYHGLKLVMLDSARHESALLPGTEDVWNAVLCEWVNNVSKYGVAKNARRLEVALSDVGKQRQLSMWGTRPFVETLPGPPSSWSMTTLQQKVAELGQREQSWYAMRESRLGGYGMYLIQRLCGWSSLNCKVHLGPGSEPEVASAVLVLSLDWRPPRGIS